MIQALISVVVAFLLIATIVFLPASAPVFAPVVLLTCAAGMTLVGVMHIYLARD